MAFGEMPRRKAHFSTAVAFLMLGTGNSLFIHGVEAAAEQTQSAARINELFSDESGNDLWSLVYFAARLNDVAQLASGGFEPTHVAKYAFQLAEYGPRQFTHLEGYLHLSIVILQLDR